MSGAGRSRGPVLRATHAERHQAALPAPAPAVRLADAGLSCASTPRAGRRPTDRPATSGRDADVVQDRALPGRDGQDGDLERAAVRQREQPRARHAAGRRGCRRCGRRRPPGAPSARISPIEAVPPSTSVTIGTECAQNWPPVGLHQPATADRSSCWKTPRPPARTGWRPSCRRRSDRRCCPADRGPGRRCRARRSPRAPARRGRRRSAPGKPRIWR